MVRALAWQARGQGFESPILHMNVLSTSEFRELATTGYLELPFGRNDEEIVHYLTHTRGWQNVYSLFREPSETDPGWVRIYAEF